jgi:hypothetical protein
MNSILGFLAMKSATDAGEKVPMGALPARTLGLLGDWSKQDGWWNREWATAAEAAEALEVTTSDVQLMVDGKELVGYLVDDALLIPSTDLARAAWEKANATGG